MSGEDLEDRVARLEADVRDLRGELAPSGPFGLPRPPTPRELARAADEHAIPAAIASLTAGIHALELLRALLRAGDLARPDGADSQRSRDGAAALARVDSALSDLADALAGKPADARSRELLAEVRELRADVADRVENGASGGEESGMDTPTASIDVEAELDSIRDELDEDGQAGDAR